MNKLLTLLSLGFLILIIGCPNNVPVAPWTPPPALNLIDLTPNSWLLLWGSGLPLHPIPTTNGWAFSIPSDPGSVHYVQVPFMGGLGTIEGQTLTVSFILHSANPKYSAQVESGESDPAMMHLFIERLNDNFSTADQYYRWWCRTTEYILGTNDNVKITLSCPITQVNWSSVYGLSDETNFSDAMKNVGWIGFTFGGNGGWGHGVRLLSGDATFELLNIQLK